MSQVREQLIKKVSTQLSALEKLVETLKEGAETFNTVEAKHQDDIRKYQQDLLMLEESYARKKENIAADLLLEEKKGKETFFKKLATELGMAVIPQDDLTELEEKFLEADTKAEQAFVDKIATMEESHVNAIHLLKSQHKADTAQYTATIESLKAQNEALKEAIAAERESVERQRESLVKMSQGQQPTFNINGSNK